MNAKTVLSNGVRIVTEQMPSALSVSAGIWINSGSRDERDDERGITHFIEHMFFKGTERRNALEIAKTLDVVGGFANAFTSKENLCIHAKVLSDHVALMIDLLIDIFLNSVFDSSEIERERQVILQEIGMIEDTPEEYAHILLQQAIWPNNPLGKPIYGDKETVLGINRDRILEHLKHLLQPEDIVVAAAGKVNHQQLVDLVAPSLEQLSSSCSRPAHREKPKIHFGYEVVNRDLEQVHVCFGLEGCSSSDPNRFACHLLNVVLGGSLSSRLFQEIRERRGLAYSVYSFLNSHEDTGLLGVYAGVAATQLQETIQLIWRELEKLATHPISEEELEAAKQYLKGNMYLNSESTDSRMNRIAKNELIFNRFISFEEIEAMIDTVTSESILNWFTRVFDPSQVMIVLYGAAGSEFRPEELERSFHLAGQGIKRA